MRLFVLLNENYQKAEKELLKTSLITDEQLNNIRSITNGDAFTYIVAQYFLMLFNSFGDKAKNEYIDSIYNKSEQFYNLLKNYNKNLLPIDNINLNKFYLNNNEQSSIYDYHPLEKMKIDLISRDKIITNLNNFPSVAKRNILNFIKNNYNGLGEDLSLAYFNDNIATLLGQYSQISNRNDDVKNMLIKKGFQSNFSIEDMIDFFSEKENLYSDKRATAKDIKRLLKSDKINDSQIIYETPTSLVIAIRDRNDMKVLGCNSFWCFSYNTRYFYEYSYNDMVYMIFNFTLGHPADSAYVLIHPLRESDNMYDDDKEKLYDAFNDPVYNAIQQLSQTLNLNEDELYELFDFDE